MLLQWHVKDPGHSTKSADGRLHLNMLTPLTQRNWSGLTMLLCRHSMGTYQGNECTCNSIIREHLATVLSACWATLDWFWPKKWVQCAQADLHLNKQKTKTAGGEWMTFPQNPCKPGKTHYHYYGIVWMSWFKEHGFSFRHDFSDSVWHARFDLACVLFKILIGCVQTLASIAVWSWVPHARPADAVGCHFFRRHWVWLGGLHLCRHDAVYPRSA